VIARILAFVHAERQLLAAVLMFVSALVAGAVALVVSSTPLGLVAGMYLGMSGEQLLAAARDAAIPASRQHRRLARRVESAVSQNGIRVPERSA
jgi:uncharacterized transporter YbjL